MSTGKVLELIVNGGKADRMVMATALLDQRIRNIQAAAARADAPPAAARTARANRPRESPARIAPANPAENYTET